MLMLPRADRTLSEMSSFGRPWLVSATDTNGCTPSVVGKPLPTSWDAKIDWKALSQRIGHADVAFTMKQYVQADLEASVIRGKIRLSS
jgi:hypothetical protein